MYLVHKIATVRNLINIMPIARLYSIQKQNVAAIFSNVNNNVSNCSRHRSC